MTKPSVPDPIAHLVVSHLRGGRLLPPPLVSCPTDGRGNVSSVHLSPDSRFGTSWRYWGHHPLLDTAQSTLFPAIIESESDDTVANSMNCVWDRIGEMARHSTPRRAITDAALSSGRARRFIETSSIFAWKTISATYFLFSSTTVSDAAFQRDIPSPGTGWNGTNASQDHCPCSPSTPRSSLCDCTSFRLDHACV